MAKPDLRFGRKLRKMREDNGLTPAQLAEMAGLHLQALSKLERGEREPRWSTVVALARAFGVSTDEFLPDPEGPEPRRRKKK
jgi:transcriptional regulator with XRE-family HTH domain